MHSSDILAYWEWEIEIKLNYWQNYIRLFKLMYHKLHIPFNPLIRYMEDFLSFSMERSMVPLKWKPCAYFTSFFKKHLWIDYNDLQTNLPLWGVFFWHQPILQFSDTNLVSNNSIQLWQELAQTPPFKGSVSPGCPHFRHQFWTTSALN